MCSRALLLCVLAAALAVALPSAGGGASAGTARAFVVGDSLAQGTAPFWLHRQLMLGDEGDLLD